MRTLLTFSLLILLVSCTTTKYYDNTLNNWRGSNSQTLIAKWGTPNQIIQLNNGSQYYVYTQQDIPAFSPMNMRTIPFVVGKGKTIGVQVPSNEPQPYFIGCTTVFSLNAKGIITDAHFKSGDCTSVAVQNKTPS